MKAVDLLTQNWVKSLVFVLTVIIIVSSILMAVSLYRITDEMGMSSGLFTARQKLIDFSRATTENLIIGFRDIYSPAKVHKRNIFSKPRDKDALISDKDARSGMLDPNERLHVLKIYKKPVKLLFKGYIQLADNSYVATINWGGKTDFKKIGETIRGYRVVDFKKNISDKKTLWGGTEKVDKSVITLERDTKEKFVLQIGRISLEKEIYAEVWDRQDNKSYDVYIGAEFLGNKVLDITPKKVIIKNSEGNELDLPKTVR